MFGPDSSIVGSAIVATPCLVAVLIALYAWWLRRAPAGEPADDPSTVDWPAIDVIVGTFNERKQIQEKLENLAQLDYPRDRVRFIIVDGGSTDGSRDVMAAWPLKDSRFIVFTFEPGGKTAQLNAGLRHARAPWIVVTDADARMPVETLQALMTAARNQPALGVIGTPILPVTAHPIEQLYWRMLNWLRRCEWRRGSAAMVMAPCYAFRRRLIDQLDDDAVADDVHVAWRVGCAGHPIGFAGPVVHEMRGPATIRSLFTQKVRRAGGILQEAFRFAPRAGGMVGAMRAGFAVRFGLLLLAPAIVAAVAVMGIVAARWWFSSEAGSSPWTTGAMLAIATPAVSRMRRPLGLAVLLGLAASVSLLLYPFFRPAASSGGAPHRVLGKVRRAAR